MKKDYFLIFLITTFTIVIFFELGSYYGSEEIYRAQIIQNLPTILEILTGLAGLGGIFAIGIAIYMNNSANKRFEVQIKQEAKLDVKADTRQQSEWKRREQERNNENEGIGKTTLNAIVCELRAVAKITHQHAVICEAKDVVYEGDSLIINRTIFNNLGANITHLPNFALEAIAKNEASYTKHQKFTIIISGRPLRGLYYAAELIKFRDVCGEYLSELEYDPETGATPTAITSLNNAGITGIG